MPGLTTYSSGVVLTWTTGQAQTPSVTNAQIALFTTIGADDGTGFVEVTGNSYARAATSPLSWGPPTGQPPVQVVNILSIPFPVSSGAWGTVLGFGLYDLNNNLLWADYSGAFPWLPFTAAVGNNGVITSPSHGLITGDKVVLTGEYGGTMPQAAASLAGLQTVTRLSTDTITIAANITVSGSGMLRKVTPLTVVANQQVTLNPAALVLQIS